MKTIAGVSADIIAGSGDNSPASTEILSTPAGIWIDLNGNLYVCIEVEYTIRKISSDGIISTIIGRPNSRSFDGASGLGVETPTSGVMSVYGDRNGTYLYFSDGAYFLWRYSFIEGIVSRYAGDIPANAGFDGDGGPATSAVLNTPMGLFLSSVGILYFADQGNNRIRMIDTSTGIINTFAGSGSMGFSGDNGPATDAELNYPQSVWGNSMGVIFITDMNNNRIRQVEGNIITTYAGTGSTAYSGNGPVTLTTFSLPTDIKGDSNGNMYIIDSGSCSVRFIDYSSNFIILIAGTGSCGISSTSVNLATSSPLYNDEYSGLTVDTVGNIFTSEYNANFIRLFTTFLSNSPTIAPTMTPTVSPTVFPSLLPTVLPSASAFPTINPTSSTKYYLATIAGNGTAASTGDNGPATLASINQPYGIWGDSNDNLFICEYGSYVIRKISSSGIITKLIGTGITSTSGASGPALSLNLERPVSIYGDDRSGTLFFGGDKYWIMRYNMTSNYVSRYVGALPGVQAFSGDEGLSVNARINNPRGLYYTSNGILYITDHLNHRIRYVNVTTGIITTIVGNGTGIFYGENISASLSCINSPRMVWLNSLGIIYIADSINYRIRSVDLNGIIRTVAGTGRSTPYNGDNQPATLANLNIPYDAKTDTVGTLYIMEYNGCRLRFVNPVGIIGTLIGSTTCGVATTNVQLVTPSTVIGKVYYFWINSLGFLYLAESENNYIRKVYYDLPPTITPTPAPSLLPSITPSVIPTVQPSSKPSNNPTDIPTIFPTLCPSDVPTVQPSVSPTTTPTSAPSAGPSFDPTLLPTIDPTCFPTVAPSDVPTVHPTLCPSISPSTQPTILPSSSTQYYLTTIAGLGTPVRSGDDGPASSASVNMPFGLWGDSNDNLFICESGSSVVRKISSGGIITTLIGTGVSSTNGLDDLASSINIESPISITGAQSNGNLFIAGNFYFIWKYNSTSKYVRRIAGTLPATRSFTGDNGPAKNATINSPRGLFYCSNGILYFADRLNHRIRTINVTTGIMKTFVGDGIARFIGENGPASLASLNSPRSVWLDTLGVAFIVDSTNHRIRSVGLDGIIRTVAGTGIDSFNGDNQPATLANLNIPYDAKTDTVGNLYIMEYNGCRLRFVNPAGIIGTLIGSTTCGTATTNVQLVTPSTVIGSSPSFWVNSLGFIYFTEDSKHYVRKLYFNLPSASPTMPPTFVPSTLPSMFPSVLPSFEPSTAPTIIPSAIPSFPPTDLPSPSPSAVPSSIPSYPPSHQPSIIPTAIPSDQPTDSPTLIPSSVSSFSSPNPSANPTRTPSSNPSILNSSPDEITLTVNSSNWKQVLSFLGVYSSSEVILASLDPSRMDTNTTSFVMFGSKDLQSSSDSIVVSSSFPYSSSYPVTRISSSYHRDSISRSAVMVGDMNGDRLSDLVVCYPLASRCLMFFGKEEALSRVGVGVTLTGQATMRYDYFGFAVSGVGDVNGDGLEDVIISAITGKVCYVIYGRSTASAFAWPSELKMADVVSGETGHKIVGDGKMVLVGISVAGVGDMNGDGLNEVALSIMSSSGSALQRYVVYVLFGVSVGGEGDVMLSSTGVVNNGFRVYGEEGYYTGFSISGGGDMNGDGLSELLIGGIVYPVSGVDVRRGERGYVVLGRRGRYDDVMLGNGSSLSSYGVKIEGGGGFIVTGIGDVNDDGYDDMMLLSSVDYIRQSNAYLVSYAGSMTSVPSLIPSSWPSSEPSSDPSKLPSSYSPSMLSSEQPTNSPSIGRPQPPTVPSPTIQPTRRPTTSPSHRGSAKPTSASPIQTRVPSLRPSLIPTLTPTIIQTIRSPTKHPSERPSRTPTTIPTVRGSPIPTVSLPAVLLPLSEYAARYVNYSSLNKQGIVYGEDGVNEIFYISSLSSDGKSRSGWSGTIIGGRGRKVYVIYPKDPIQPVNRIVLGDFNESVDVIDVSHIRGIGSLSDVSYLTHPLTLFLPDNQKIVISSYESMKELSETNFIFDSSSSSYSDVSVGGEENLWLSMSFIFPVCLLGICLLGVGYVSMLNNEKKRKTDLLLTDKMLEEDGSRVKPSVDIKEDIIPSSVESEKHSIHHSRPSLYKNSEEEEGAISMSDSLDTNDYEISLVNMSEEEEGIAHSESHEASSSHSSSDDCFF